MNLQNAFKKKAKLLRRKGHSYSEIQKITGIPKSTLSNWFKNCSFSQKLSLKLNRNNYTHQSFFLRKIQALRREKLREGYKKIAEKAMEEFEEFKAHPLFLAGLIIYWGEGDKKFKNGQVRVSNTDGKMLRVFVEFLKMFCGVAKTKIRGYILVYPDLSKRKSIKFWSQETGVKPQRFYKTTIIQGRKKGSKLKHGICTIVVSDKNLKKKLLTWLEILPEFLISAGIV